MSRIKIVTIHFFCSLLLAAVVFAFVKGVWFPDALVSVMDAWKMLSFLIGFLAFLFPVLTAIIWRQNKKGQRGDFACIVGMQILLAAGGLYVIGGGRPVYIAAVGERFDVVAANEISQADLVASRGVLPVWGPLWVGVKTPEDVETKNRTVFGAFAGKDYGHFPQLHIEFKDAVQGVEQNSIPVQALIDGDKRLEKYFNKLAVRHQLKLSDIRYLPLRSGVGEGIVLWARSRVVGIEAIVPR